MGNDFNSNKKYNSENFVSLSIQTNKKCFSQGEFITGSLYLKGKPGLIQTQLIDPLAMATLTEFQHYSYEEEHGHDDRREIDVNEEKIIFQLRLDFSDYRGANLMNGVQIPFSVQITNCHPTCYFDFKTYVRHYFTIEFPSIQSKRTIFIVIKNHQNFTLENFLYKSPAIEQREKTKHKLMFSKGKFAAVLKLAKNVFTYDENINFELEIDCTQLDLKIKSVEIDLLRIENRNYKNNETKVRNSSSKKISSKKITLVKGQPKYLIQDCIQFPLLVDFNPIQIYKQLDSLPEIDEKLIRKIHLAPSCIGGLLSVDYYLRVELNIDSILSTDEKIKMRIDFYSPFNNQNMINQPQISTTGLSQAYHGGSPNNYYPNNTSGLNQINNTTGINYQNTQGIVGLNQNRNGLINNNYYNNQLNNIPQNINYNIKPINQLNNNIINPHHQNNINNNLNTNNPQTNIINPYYNVNNQNNINYVSGNIQNYQYNKLNNTQPNNYAQNYNNYNIRGNQNLFNPNLYNNNINNLNQFK